MRALVVAIVLLGGCEESAGFCDSCGAGEICVQYFDGNCGGAPRRFAASCAGEEVEGALYCKGV